MPARPSPAAAAAIAPANAAPVGARQARLLRGVWLVGSAMLAIVLLALLFLYGGIDLAAVTRALLAVKASALVEITLLLAVNNALAGEKWRRIAARLQPATAGAMPRLSYFAFTSIGVALGQVLPAQLSLVLSRSLGAHLHGGRVVSRGMAATVFDYFFDVVVAAFFALASILVLLGGGGPGRWLLYAAAFCGIAVMLCGAAARATAAAGRFLASLGPGRLWRLCATLAQSPLLAGDIMRPLLAISLLRFLVLVIIGWISARAIGVDLTLWQIAAAQPFAVVANAMALTPASLGVNEWTLSSALFGFGVPFALAVKWAVAARLLMAAAAIGCGIVGTAVAVSACGWRRRGAA